MAAINALEAIRNKLKELEGTKAKKLTWKPEDEHVVRCLATKDDESLGYEIGWHYGVDGGRKIYCPASTGEQCDFCDLAQYLYSWKDENGVDKPKDVKQRDFEWFKKIQRGVKHYVPVAVRKLGADGKTLGDEYEGPFYWEMSPRTFKSLLTICVDDDWNTMHMKETGEGGGGYKILTSADHGLDISVSLKKAGEKGNQTKYDLTDIKERKMFSKLLSNKVASKALLEKVPTIEEAVKTVTPAEVSKAFLVFKASGTETVVTVDANAGLEYPSNNGEKLTGTDSVDDVTAKLQAMVDKTNANKHA